MLSYAIFRGKHGEILRKKLKPQIIDFKQLEKNLKQLEKMGLLKRGYNLISPYDRRVSKLLD